ncbi:MAG: hypothetical protein IPM63_12475 [Acidobacteriota bacterium]|nr:MAG: hypothetical protein IPM63_12475 [Acidobacteriota bacterium]
MKTITKFRSFVIVACLAMVSLSGCSVVDHLTRGRSTPDPALVSKDFAEPEVIARIDSALIDESSGLTASKCRPYVFWTHNDSGGGPYVYAFGLKGVLLGVWKVEGAKNRDWEDIASAKEEDGKCYLYIGDIGDNEQGRDSVTVYRVEEPDTSAGSVSRKKEDAARTAEASEIEITYPDGKWNAETLMVHPSTFDLYVVSKEKSPEARVFRVRSSVWRDAGADSKIKSEAVGKLTMPSVLGGFLTGGEISPDGRRVVICDYVGAYELSLENDQKEFDSVWKSTPQIIETGPREQGESVAYSSDGSALFLTSEKVPVPLIRIKRK